MKIGSVKKKLIVLLSGTALAQVIHLLFTPVLTRLYTPEEFGDLALLISLIGVTAAIATGKFDLAIVMAKPQDKKQLDRGITRIALITSSVFLTLSICLYFLNYQKYSILLAFLSITCFFRAKYLSKRAILNSYGEYKEMASGRILENASNGLLAVALAPMGLGSIALMISKTFSFILPTAYFSKKSRPHIDKEASGSITESFKKHKSFPQFSIMAELLTQLNLNFAIFGFAYLFGQEVVGHLSMTTRVLSLPINFIGLAFLDVFREKATQDYLKQGSCSTIFKKFATALFGLGLLGFLPIFFFGEEIFGFVLGKEWIKAGQYASIAIGLYSIRLISSPLGYIYYLTDKQRQDMVFRALIVILSLTVLFISKVGTLNDKITLTIYCYTISIAYLAYIALAYRHSFGTTQK